VKPKSPSDVSAIDFRSSSLIPPPNGISAPSDLVYLPWF